MFGISDGSYKDIKEVRIMNLASNIFLNPDMAIEGHLRYQRVGLDACIKKLLEEGTAQVELMLLEPNPGNLKDVESKISNDRLAVKGKAVQGAWRALFDKVEQDELYKERVKEPSTFCYYAMKTSMPIGIISVKFGGENSIRNFVHVDLYTAALDTEDNRRVINIWERNDPENYRFFVRNFDDIKRNKELCSRMPTRADMKAYLEEDGTDG